MAVRFLLFLLIIIVVLIFLGIIGALIGIDGIGKMLFPYITYGIFISILLYLFRFFYSWVIAIIYNEDGFSALNLSHLIYKNNKKDSFLLFLFCSIFIALWGVLFVLPESLETFTIYSLLLIIFSTVLSTAFEIYSLIIVMKIITSVIDKKEDLLE